MIRLQKVIAENSEYSRRKAEQLILDNKVKVNGVIVNELGTKVNSNDEITVDNLPLIEQKKVYYVLNKPMGTVSSRQDEKNRPTIVDLIDTDESIYPIGRLDFNTTGIILLTNDGVLANGLMHPRYKIPKTYIAKIKGKMTKQKLLLLQKGVIIDGRKTAPAKVQIIKLNFKKETATIKITIHEGRNHQIKKMVKAIGGTVVRLKRTEYSFLDVNDLPLGGHRTLKIKEIKKLYSLISK